MCECLTVLRNLPWKQRRATGRREQLEQDVRRKLSSLFRRSMRGRGSLPQRLGRAVKWIDGPQVTGREVVDECRSVVRCCLRYPTEQDWRAHLEEQQLRDLAPIGERPNDGFRCKAIALLWAEAHRLGWKKLWNNWDKDLQRRATEMACQVLDITLRTLRTAGASWPRERGVAVNIWDVELELRPTSERIEDWDVDENDRPIRPNGKPLYLLQQPHRRPRGLTDAVLEDWRRRLFAP